MMNSSHIKTMAEAESYLAGLTGRSTSYEQRLANVKSILESFGNPQDVVPAIHIAGTSGKGSTAYFCAALLKEAGYKVGLCVSPHVNSVAERAQVNGAPLPDDEYLQFFNEFANEVEGRDLALTYIEFLDIFMYWLFARLGLDYMVIEVGLGGLLDPTNVMMRADKTCVITDIGFDHTEILGDTLAKIASQKAGIIHEGNDVVMYEQDGDAMDVVTRTAREKGAHLRVITGPSRLAPSSLPLYQRRNWGLALAAVTFRLERDNKPALDSDRYVASAVQVPGRFEVFVRDGVTIVLDAAHNPQKIAALVAALDDAYPGRPLSYVVSFAKNKAVSYEESVRILTRRPGEVFATELSVSFGAGHAALPAENIAKAAGGGTVIRDPGLALRTAVFNADKNVVIVVTGSFYLIDTVRRLLLATKS